MVTHKDVYTDTFLGGSDDYMYIICPVLYVYKMTDDFVSKIYTIIFLCILY